MPEATKKSHHGVRDSKTGFVWKNKKMPIKKGASAQPNGKLAMKPIQGGRVPPVRRDADPFVESFFPSSTEMKPPKAPSIFHINLSSNSTST